MLSIARWTTRPENWAATKRALRTPGTSQPQSPKHGSKRSFLSLLRALASLLIRSAIKFSPDCGGVFDVLLRLVRYGLGGAQGPGTQFVSWIREADFARAIQLLIERDEFEGTVNLSSPCPLPMGRPLELACPALDAGERRVSHADRIGIGAQKPACCSQSPAGCGFPVLLSRLARGLWRTAKPLASKHPAQRIRHLRQRLSVRPKTADPNALAATMTICQSR